MPDGQNQYFEPVDGLAHIEQLASVNARVRRRKEQKRRGSGKKQRKNAGIEKTLEDEQKQRKTQSIDGNEHIDFHA